jgi:hypothetical protein
MADVREGRNRLLRGGVLLVLAPILVLSALPVLLLGGASWLAQAFNWEPAIVQVATALFVLATAGLLAWLGIRGLSRSFGSLARSKNEFAANLNWLKAALRSTASAPAGEGEFERSSARRRA